MANHRHENPQGKNPDVHDSRDGGGRLRREHAVEGCTNAAERRMRESGHPLRHLPAQQMAHHIISKRTRRVRPESLK
jgi:hypothetical protein